MKIASIIFYSTLIFLPASGSAIAAPQSELSCETLDGAALDACIAKLAQKEGEQLIPIFRGAAQASGDACDSLPGPAIGACLEKAQDAADEALNQVYEKAIAAIREHSQSKSKANTWEKQLKSAQNSWISFRDADCGDLVFSEYQDGTGAGSASLECILDKTLMRTQELQIRYVDRR